MEFRNVVLSVLFVMAAGVSTAAQAETATGVVTNVNTEKQSLTIRNSETGQRRTYFLDEGTRISSEGKPINLNRLRRGNEVTLHYRATDRGRVIEAIRVPEPTEVVDVIPVEVTEIQTVSGRVTGVRPTQRTITIRDDATRKRRTLKIPEAASIVRDGEPLALRNIEPGDNIVARYRVTDRGLILVTGRSPQSPAEPAVDAPELTALPKTAGHAFGYMFAAIGFLGLGMFARYLRRRRA